MRRVAFARPNVVEGLSKQSMIIGGVTGTRGKERSTKQLSNSFRKTSPVNSKNKKNDIFEKNTDNLFIYIILILPSYIFLFFNERCEKS